MDANQLQNLGLQNQSSTTGGADSVWLPPQAPIAQPALGSTQPVQAVSTSASETESEALDEEWVLRAREVVEKTKGDPFTQSKELNKVKAEYLKARFNKDLKIGEDGS